MEKNIPHYRSVCVSDFRKSKPGSINLEEYANGFGDSDKIALLNEELEELGKEESNVYVLAAVSDLHRRLKHEFDRAIFPYRYVDYTTAIFGSARLQPESPEYKEVVEISQGIVSALGTNILTGGGPGVMEAGNLGLKKANRKGAHGLGLTVKLPFEETHNDHMDLNITHQTFGTRLNEFADRMNGSISWYGGGGTDLENDFVYQLKQVNHLEDDFPIILKKSIWEMVQEAKMQAMYYQRVETDNVTLISPEDLKLVTYVNHPADAIQAVIDHYVKWCVDVWDKLDEKSQQLIVDSEPV